jgi:hypothetical protein
MNRLLHNYVELGIATKDNMHIRKSEFLTEVILSFFVAAITLQLNGDPTYAGLFIAAIHSFNLARAFEAYQEAQIEQKYSGENP